MNNYRRETLDFTSRVYKSGHKMEKHKRKTLQFTIKFIAYLQLACVLTVTTVLHLYNAKVERDKFIREIDMRTYGNNIVSTEEPMMVVDNTNAIKEGQFKEEEQPRFATYSEYDEYLLSKIIYCEAGIESYECKLWIGDCIINRCLDSRFPNTIRDVIFQGHQFSPTFDGSWQTREPDEESNKAAIEVLQSTYSISDGALYFESVSGGSSWHMNNLIYIRKIDNTRFYK